MADFKVRYDEEKGYYDLVFDDEGNLVLEDSLDNAINMSLFCDRRADESEVQVPELRRGWWGNTLNDNNHEIGSKLWLLEQRRASQNTLNDCGDYIRESLQWMLDDNVIKDLEVSTEYQNKNTIIANIQFTGYDNSVDVKTYELFLNTIPNG